MSPTILIHGKYRFFFNSREEKRMHVHVQSPTGVAKFWLEPIVSLENYYRFSSKELRVLMKIVEEQQNEFKNSWKKKFGQ